ncbi:Flp family type IVb pilin [Comamonas thiooxydans]|uniref:Flp family type IVb pilin n=1 Tax=Comamonas thiooxydans TaxID=363952 RepID=UPI0021150AC7|nr:Flp family type IVb pilin [Comamonas thiooxydans]UUE94812.1 Flp family type IVb pilin [Comamonas thiooxydans]
MNKIAQQFGHSLQSFVSDEEGAQVIEYALVVAVVSIALVLLMKTSITSGLFTAWLAKVQACLSAGNACAN